MLAIAVLIRLDSPGPVLFRHRRPARSVRVRGRDLEGRADLCPPPGGYDRRRRNIMCRPISRWSNFAPCTGTRRRAFPHTTPAHMRERTSAASIRTSRTIHASPGSDACFANSPLTNSRTYGPCGGGYEARRAASRGARSAAISHAGGNDQVHLQARDHRPRPDQRSEIA